MKKILFILFFMLSTCSTIYAEDNVLTPYKKHGITILWENDFLNFLRSDRYYSNGTRIGYTSKEYDYFNEDNPMSWAKNISIVSYNKPHITRFHMSINQEMYTPATHGPGIGKNDHPYGGFLYLNTGIFNRTADTEEHIGIKLGVVGSYSLAGQLQTFLHSSTGQLVFAEWDKSQLNNEFIFNPYYQITLRKYIFKTKPFSMDILGTFDTALGNADTHFGAYGLIRLGHNLDNDFGMPKMNLEQDYAPVHSDKFSIYVFAGGGAKVTLHNIFVKGNSVQSDLGYNLSILRYEASAGLVMSFYGVRLGYIWTYYTKDYTVQPYDHHAVGALLVEFSF